MRRRVGRVAVLAVVVGVAGCGGGAEKKGDAAGGGESGGGAAARGGGEDAPIRANKVQQADVEAAASDFARKVNELAAKGFPPSLGSPPVLAIERVDNRTADASFDASTLKNAITDKLLAGGQVKVVASGAADVEDVEALERRRELEDSRAGGGVEMGTEEAATGVVMAEVSSEVAAADGVKTYEYTFSIRLIAIQTRAVVVSSITKLRKTQE